MLSDPKKASELRDLLKADGVPKEEIPEEVWGYIGTIDSKITYIVDESYVNWDKLFKMVEGCIATKNWSHLSQQLRKLTEDITDLARDIGLRKISYI